MEHELANPLTHQLKIGIDIDNTISQSHPAIWEEFKKEFKGRILFEKSADFYHLEKTTSATLEEVEVFIDKIERDEEFILSFPVYTGSIQILQKWILEGHKLHYITARPHHSRASTLSWLKKHKFPTKNVSLDLHDREKDGDSVAYKARIVKSEHIDIMIEDSLEIAQGISIPTLLIDHPWNRNVVLPSRIVRVKDWNEIEGWVKKFSASL